MVAGFIEEEMVHTAMVGGRREGAQLDNRGRGAAASVAEAAQSTFTPCPCSRAAVASSSGIGGTKMTAHLAHG